uniref:Large ribosomal subunit protein bL20c n=1 Tax=Aconitum coreanum TaxID=662772 RepID=A0A1D8D7B9_ACOCO|nr:ribosomal protein L20 [Aconitum coreanum]ANV27777.1 ribosomal protein L20 [Aconitum coreanum]AOS85955.1 ribosomal protein L20 [Aconitum coreanum]QFO90559.1 ribosomal protein L20 [Aconitum coreanum]
MTRIRRGYIARRRRTKIRLFASTFRGAHSRLTRTTFQQKMRALVSAHRDRGRQKRNFRRLWITRINAGIRENDLYNSYNRSIHDMYKRKRLINRKMLAQIGVLSMNSFYEIYSRIIDDCRVAPIRVVSIYDVTLYQYNIHDYDIPFYY